MLDDDAKRTLELSLIGLKTYDQRMDYLRAFMDFVILKYGEAAVNAERMRLLRQPPKQVEEDPNQYRMYPTWREIMVMTRQQGRQYQGLWRFEDRTVWIGHDTRFLDDGQGLGFYRAWRKAREKRKDDAVMLSDAEKEGFVGFEAENEITESDILEYGDAVLNGKIAIVIGHTPFTDRLANNYKHPVSIDGQDWPTVEHFIVAQELADGDLRERIRVTPKLTEVREMAKKQAKRPDWAEVCDDQMRKALWAKFGDPAFRRSLWGTAGFAIRAKQGGPYWGGSRNRLGELLVELREKLMDERD